MVKDETLSIWRYFVYSTSSGVDEALFSKCGWRREGKGSRVGGLYFIVLVVKLVRCKEMA